MKPFMKVGSFLLAVMMCCACLFVTGCTPISLNKEWSYKTSDKTLDIGVYIYSLDSAYSQAKSYASEQLDDYDESTDEWLDKEITDDDDNKQVAREWIKDQADKMCRSYLALDAELKKLDAEVDEATIASADEQAQTYWNVGQYADYGYIMPMSEDLEPYGISFDSFKYCTMEYSVKYSALFEKLYKDGGSKEVSDAELTEFFTENYVDYSYFSVNLYESTTDEAGTSSDVALSEADAKKLTDELDGYAKDVNGGTSYEDMIEKYMSANELESDPSTSSVEQLEKSSLGDELKDAVKELENGKATTLKVGDGNTAVYYLVYKRNIKDDVDDYIGNDSNRDSVLSAMKSEEFSDYVDELAKNLECEANTSVLDKYKPDMFFVKPEETTAAEETTAS